MAKGVPETHPEEKRCVRCGESKPRTAFYADKRKRDGLRAHCRSCHKLETDAVRRRRPEKARARHRRWREKPGNMAKLRTAGRAWKFRTPGYRAVHRAALARGERPDPEALSYASVLHADPCSYCGRVGGTVDHIDSVASGGSAAFDNMTAACMRCNQRKAARSLLGFMLLEGR